MDKTTIKAVITGGASGLGQAVANQWIEAGAQVVLIDLNDAGATGFVPAQHSDRLHAIQADVTDEQAIEQAMGKAHNAMGGLNVLVNCAGILGPGRVLGKHGPMPLENFAKTVAVNLIGSFNAAKAAAAWMQHNNQANDNGVIINTASIAAFEGQIGQAAYSASKGGVVGMTLPMARELARFHIRVMTIAPGVFHTPMVDGMTPEIQDSLSAGIPYPSRLGQAEEFAQLATHIVDNPYLNGSVIRLDGAARLAPK